MSVGTAELENAVFEPPFPIPKSWTWCRLGNVIEAINGLAFKPTDWKDSGLPIVRIQNLNDSSASFNFTDRQIPDSVHLYGGELLFAWSGTPGTSFGAHIWQYREAALNQHIFKLVFSEDLFDKRYLKIALNNLVERFIEQAHGGVGLAHITRKVFDDIAIPIPPMREQRHIVEQYENIATLCECVDRNYSELQSLSVVLKSHILDIAIRGDLVPQDLADEPASVLLDRIRITADKPPCPKRTNETIEPPFPIPESWRWTTLGSVCELIAGVSYEKRDVVSSGIRILRGGNLDEEHRISFYDDDVFLPMQYIDKTKTVEKGDVVLVASTGSASVIGRAAIAPFSMTNVQIGAFLRIARSRMPELSEWIQILLTGERFRDHIRQSAKGTNIKNLKSNHFSLFLVPIPPLAEQRRIVAKVEELFSVIDAMATK